MLVADRHDDAAALVRAGVGRLCVSNHVVGETWTLLRRRAGHAAAVGFLDRLARLPDVEMVHVDAATEAEAWRWLRRHDERGYSFVDATSFALMRRRRIREALAFDAAGHGGVHGAQRQVAVAADQLRDPQPVGRVHRRDRERARREVAEESDLRLGSEPRRDQVGGLGDHQGGDDQRARMGLKERQARPVVAVAGVDVGVQGRGVDDDRYRAASAHTLAYDAACLGGGGFFDRAADAIAASIPGAERQVIRPITDEGVAVGGAFDSHTATGMMPVAHRVAGALAFRRS